MADKIKLVIMTPEQTLFDGEVDSFVAPGVAGELGIYPQHQNLLTPLAIDGLHAVDGENAVHYAIHGGFLEIRDGVATVLADSAEISAKIDIERAERAKERAKKYIEEGHSEKVDIMRAKLAMERALVRLHVSAAANAKNETDKEQ